MKKYEVDAKELIEQYYEDIIKKGEYAEVRVVIGKGEKESYPSVSIKKVGHKEIACLIMSLECIAQEIRKKYPLANIFTKFINIDSEEKY